MRAVNYYKCEKEESEMKIAEIENKVINGKYDEVRGKCYFCGKPLNGFYWCFGCHKFICEHCDNNTGEAMGKHSVEAHK